jgi:hypothetical protein
MDPELFQRMQEAAARFRSGESDFEEIITPAGPAHLVRDPTDPRGFRIDFVGDGARRSVPMQEYPASATRPPGYPAPLPFLEGCVALVNTVEQSVTWVDPPGAEAAFGRLTGDMVQDGWTVLDPEPSSQDPAGPCRVLEKEDVERTLCLSHEGGRVRLVLSERHAGPE